MVYNSTKEAYESLMSALPELFKDIDSEEEYLPQSVLAELEEKCRQKFFHREMIPTYDPQDVSHILKYYAQKESEPKFYTFDQVDREKLDITSIAQTIWDEDMGARKKKEYLDELWDNGDDNLLQLFFGRKIYFLRMIDIELLKIGNPKIYADINNVTYDKKELSKLPLTKIKEVNPALEAELRSGAFAKSKVDGVHVCAECGEVFTDKKFLQVDHIVPMNQGGLSVPENLQILCRKCNAEWSDKMKGGK